MHTVVLLLCFLSVVQSSEVKVIVLTIGHSGSKTLVRILDEHPNIKMGGELLFNSKFKYDLSLAQKKFQSIFSKQQNVTVVGFKLLYHQIWMHPVPFFAWMRIRYPELRIVHLIRENYFEHYLSFYKDSKHTDVKRIIDHISDTGLRVEAMKKLVVSHPGQSINIFYEDITRDFHGELNKIFTFLDVPLNQIHVSSRDRSKNSAPWTRVPDWRTVCNRIQERESLDNNLGSCLKRWSDITWQTQADSAINLCSTI